MTAHGNAPEGVPDDVRTRILDAAERLFYERGIQAVGMDELRTAAGVSLKRLYGTFPAKHDLVEAYLRRRDARWRADLAAYVDAATEAGGAVAAPADRLLAVFDWLGSWFAAQDFRGCAFINAYGELGATSEGVARVTRDHKQALRAYLADLARPSNHPDPAALASQLALLVDGAITAAAISGEPASAHTARTARTAAAALIGAIATTPNI
ncbi:MULTISPECIES: TetR/AcrR family transcriptional regulator [Streptomyces]|uniref:TetR/AcrR family transcriptional regulator n=1 Tax=Streptomyces TaxID=1883 RepID=UPI0019656D66|nr:MULTISPECIES: TetR/AcrR family transcriptional regulator [Streptomyces]QRX93445.1 TetR/AcrR family transcriptional regulator [Streptomyces noursei]UJB43116.1 TetR/AcrR family transcriptional regulator [Streptomyces sp. A1-5]